MKYIAVTEIDNDELINGNICITTPRELYCAILDPHGYDIQLTKEFVDKYFTEAALNTFITESIALNPNLRITVDDAISISDDRVIKELSSLQTPEEVLYGFHKRPKDYMKALKVLCDNYFEEKRESLAANNKVATLHLQLGNLTDERNALLEEKEKILESRNQFEATLDTILKRINYNYDKSVNGNEMFQVTNSRYDKILYVKEITRVHYTDSLLYYLQELLKTLYNMPARFVVIEPPYAYQRYKLYKDLKPHWDLYYSDVYSKDIFMAGMQAELMKDILKNSSCISYLIVLDRSGYSYPHIYGDNVEIIYTASDTKDAEIFEVPMDRVISYREDTLNIPYVNNFDKLSIEKRIQTYSSMPIVKTLIELIERR